MGFQPPISTNMGSFPTWVRQKGSTKIIDDGEVVIFGVSLSVKDFQTMATDSELCLEFGVVGMSVMNFNR